MIKEGLKKYVKLGLFAEVRGGRGPSGFKGPNLLLGQFSNAKKRLENARKLGYYLITGPKLGGGGRGQRRFSQKPKFDIFFCF